MAIIIFLCYNYNMKTTIPQYIKPFLWSFDLAKIDLKKDKKRIISNILNLGTKQATDWLFSIYSQEDINLAIANPLPGEWSAKSLNFWSLVLGVKTQPSKQKVETAV